ncbi:MAG: PRC-barrel domain-containing protein [Candidatus Thorarchaeota archaeon]|jgi:sporulation protein YlmC with PRC-barrel domain
MDKSIYIFTIVNKWVYTVEKCIDVKYSEIKKKPVVDSKGETLGNIIDFIFTIEENRLAPKSIIVGGSRMEELLESLGVRPDEDPIFSVDNIDVIGDDKVTLTVDGETLCSTLTEGIFAENDRKLSQISKAKVIDSDGFNIGNVIDVWFDDDAQVWLLLGGGFLEEALERIGVQPDIDLIAGPTDIDVFTDKEIKLKWTRFQLESNCETDYERLKRQLSSRAKPKDYKHTHLRLGPSRTQP